MLTQSVDPGPRRLGAVLCLLALGGCSPTPQAEPQAPPPPSVPVCTPLLRQVVDTAEFAARTAAVESVKVRARVWGHLGKFQFTEGAEVKKGDLLFQIDRRPYQVAVDRAAAELERANTRHERMATDAARARTLGTSRAISREDLDRVASDLAEARHAADSAKAALEAAKLDLLYTEVRAPISGQVGRAMVTEGNLISSAEGAVLTTIVSVDPVHVFFDVDDLASASVRQLFQTRKAGGPPIPVALGLVNEQGFPHTGEVDFVDNQVDAGTGTLKVRGVFRNPRRVLTPGLFGRVRVPLGSPRRAMLVTDRAVDTDQGQKILFVVGKDDMIERRPVVLGEMHDGLREIVSGVTATDRVVVGAIQRVRPGAPVVPKDVEMPSAQDKRSPLAEAKR
jgi:multidrug efflux system membrane fusion protein